MRCISKKFCTIHANTGTIWFCVEQKAPTIGRFPAEFCLFVGRVARPGYLSCSVLNHARWQRKPHQLKFLKMHGGGGNNNSKPGLGGLFARVAEGSKNMVEKAKGSLSHQQGQSGGQSVPSGDAPFAPPPSALPQGGNLLSKSKQWFATTAAKTKEGVSVGIEKIKYRLKKQTATSLSKEVRGERGDE